MKDVILQKQEQVQSAVEKMKSSNSVIAFDYHGLSVEEFQNLRNNLRENGVEVQVLKNNISRRAAKELGQEDFAADLKGPKAIAFSASDIIAPAKEIFAFAKTNDKVKVASGVVNGEFYAYEQLQILATLPSRETLLTQLAAGMYGTLSQLAMGLNMVSDERAEQQA